MEEKLRSILRQTRWSLVLRGAIFALAWLFLPWWLFAIAALCLYFIPALGAGTVIAPFFTLLVIAFFQPGGSVWFAVIAGAIFVYMLFIKDLLIIDRKTAYEMLSVVLVFLLFREFYEIFGGAFDTSALFYATGAAAIFGALVAGFIKHFANDPADPKYQPIRRIAGWISFVLGAQILIAGLVLPVDFIDQSAIAFLAAVVMMDLIPRSIFGDLTREKAFITSGLAFSIIVLILAGVQWRL